MGRPKRFDPELAVDQAMDLFWRKGYSETTPQDLTDGLGIGKGSLYHAFTSKRALFGRALARYTQIRRDGVEQMLRGPGPVRERIRATLLRLAVADPALTSRGCLAVNTMVELGGTDAEAAAVVRALFDRIEAAFRTALEEGRRTGELAADRDCDELASNLLTTFLGMSVLAKAGDPDRLRRTVDAAMTTL